MNNLLGIGISGLLVHQRAIGTTGNNITNANVPGYSRQRVIFDTQSEQLMGAGYMGTGARVTDVERIVNQFMINQLRLDTSNFRQMEVLASNFSQLDSLLANESTGIAPALQEFFAALQQSSQDPTSTPVRQVVLSSAGSLAERFNALYSALQTQDMNINRQLDSAAKQITSLGQSLAELNADIAEQGRGGGQTGQPNALLDKRDELLLQLSELVGVKVTTEANGVVNVYMGNGQALVIGNHANALTTQPSRDDPRRQDLVFSAGATSQSVSKFLDGGVVGGLLDYREQSLDVAYNTLGRLAMTLADTFNSQQQVGLDLNGHFGSNLFTDINHAATQLNRAIPATSNGDARLSVFIDDSSALTTSDYQLNIGAGGSYTLVRLSDGVQVDTGTDVNDIAIDGFQISLSSGTLQAGDSFRIAPTRTGAQDIGVVLHDPVELAFAQPIRSDASLDNQGSGVISPGQTLAVHDASGALQSLFATPEQLSPPLLVRFTSATAYEILDNSDPANPVALTPPQTGTFTPGQTNTVTVTDSVSGDAVYRFELSGNPASGDTFTIDYNTNGSSDNRNALAMAELRLSDTVGGRMDYESAYGQLVEQVGTNTAKFKINRDAADTLVSQAQANRDAVSGVNLDEEAANLIRFEQAYNASAQVITIARSLFDSLLGALR